MTTSPMQSLAGALRQTGLVRFLEHFATHFPTAHLNDLVFDDPGPDRVVTVNGRRVVNFGCDCFLGLDRHPRVQEAVARGMRKWGTHNGVSRSLAGVRPNADAEEKLARWLGTEAVLIYPSVTLAHLGAIPGLLSQLDLLVVDEHAHNSIQEGAKIAKANGVRVAPLTHADPDALRRVFQAAGRYHCALVAIDGIYSMSGEVPPLRELNEVCLTHDAVLYVNDAQATGVLGEKGRGTVYDALGSYENTLVVGSLSPAFAALGGFIGCTAEMKRLLKMRSNTYIFGGPVPPPYLEAVCAVCDILTTDEYEFLRARLRHNVLHVTRGLKEMGLTVYGGRTPTVAVLVGDEEETLAAGAFLFECGYYVPSAIFPVVPYHSGMLRIQVNANHRWESINGLLDAIADLHQARRLPRPKALPQAA